MSKSSILHNAKRAEGRAVLDAALSEQAFQQQIIDLALVKGWYVYHTYDSRRSNPGWPDLALVHPGKKLLLFLEVKTQTGRVTQPQQRMIDTLAKVRLTTAHIVRPSDWELVEKSL